MKKITINDIEVHNGGYWAGGTYYSYNGLRLCGETPIIHLSNYNENEVKLRRILPLIEGAKCIYKKDKPWYRYDCNERAIPCGSVSVQIWDLRDVFGNTKPLGELLDYEECCMLGIENEYVKPSKRNSLFF